MRRYRGNRASARDLRGAAVSPARSDELSQIHGPGFAAVAGPQLRCRSGGSDEDGLNGCSMSHINPEDVPLPARLRRFLRASAVAVAAIVFALVVAIVGYGALIFGWHPIPSTALGCSLHKRFHSFHGAPVKFENLELATDCLKVTVHGRDEIVRDAQKIAAARAWFDSRSDLWVENFLNAPDQSPQLLTIRACNPPPGSSDGYVYLTEDWIGSNPSKRLQRPICRAEWREIAAILSTAGANR